MGEVYQAKDTRLGRTVAIKLLPAHLSANVELRQRLEREARAISALSHPHICALYDIGHQDGTDFLVMEYLEGQTLSQRLAKGPLPVDEALGYAQEMAEALDQAHRHGVVHRDLKPANIMLTKSGAKLLDFGLAKLIEEPDHDLTTQGGPLTSWTAEGAIIGTVSYMSPEQAEGKKVDARSDIFTFGAVMYEMFSGRSPFQRDSTASTLAAILKEDPRPLGELVSGVPLELQRIVKRCLRKDPARRFQHMGDVGIALQDLKEESDVALVAGPVVATASKPRRGFRRTAVLLLAGLLAGVGISLWLSRAVPPSNLAHRLVPVANDAGAESQPSWSPDGQSLAYVAEVSGEFQIFSRALSALEPVQLTFNSTTSTTKDESGSFRSLKWDPFWSADGSRIYYIATYALDTWALYSVGAAGGPPELVHANIESAALSRDGKLMALLRLDPASRAISVWLSSPPGSEPRPYSEAPFTQRYFDTGVLRFSPQGDRLVALIYTAGEPTEFWVLPLPSGRVYQVLRSSTADCVGFFPFSVLPDGRHILLEMAPRPDWTHHLFVADLERDVARPLTQTTRAELQPAVSPDGKRIAFTAQDKGSEMVRVPLDGSLMQTLRASAWYEASPSWSRRSGEIAYVCDRRGAPEIWMYDPRSGWQRPAVKREDFGNTDTFGLFDPVVSPDGQRIAYSRLGRTIGIWISPVAGGAPVALTPGTQERMHYSPAWSPDGKWIAYNSFVGGKNVLRKAEVGSRSPPVALPPFSYGATAQTAWSPRGDWIACRTPNGLTLVKADGGGSRVLATKVPLVFGWSDDGTLIYGLRVNTGRLVLVSINVETGREKRIADTGPAPRPPGPYSDAPLSGFSLSPDGKSFVTSISRSDSDIWILENFQMPAKSLWKFR